MASHEKYKRERDGNRNPQNMKSRALGAESSWSDFEQRAAGYAEDRMNEARADVMLDAIQVIQAMPDKVDSVIRNAVVKELDNSKIIELEKRKIIEGAINSAEVQVHDHLKGLASDIIASMKRWTTKEDNDNNSIITDMVSLTQTIQDSTQKKLESSWVQLRDSHDADGESLATIPEDWPLEMADAIKSATENQVNEAVSILRQGITDELPPYVQNHSIAYAFLKAKIGEEDDRPPGFAVSGRSMASGADVESTRTVTCADTVATSEDWTDAKEYFAKACATKLSWADMSEEWDDDDWAPMGSSRMSDHVSDFSLDAVAEDLPDVSRCTKRTGRASSADESSARIDKRRANERRKKTISMPRMFHSSASRGAARGSPSGLPYRYRFTNAYSTGSFDDGSSTDDPSQGRWCNERLLQKSGDDDVAEQRGYGNCFLSDNTRFARGRRTPHDVALHYSAMCHKRPKQRKDDSESSSYVSHLPRGWAQSTRSEPITENHDRGSAMFAGTRSPPHDKVCVTHAENAYHCAAVKRWESEHVNQDAPYATWDGGGSHSATSLRKSYAHAEAKQKRLPHAMLHYANSDLVNSSSSNAKTWSRFRGHDDGLRLPLSMRSDELALKEPAGSGVQTCVGHVDSLEEEIGASLPLSNKYIPKTKVQDGGPPITSHTMTLNLPKHGSTTLVSPRRKKDNHDDERKNKSNTATSSGNSAELEARSPAKSSAEDVKAKESTSPLECSKSELLPVSNRSATDVPRTESTRPPETVSQEKSKDLRLSSSILDEKSENAASRSTHYRSPLNSPATGTTSPAPLPLVPRAQKNKTKATDDNAVLLAQITPSRLRQKSNSAAPARPRRRSRDDISNSEEDDDNTATPQRLDSDGHTSEHASNVAGAKSRRKQKRSVAPDYIDRRMRRCITDVNLFGGVGSQGHPNLCARVCLYFWKGECRNGKDCQYCHFPHLMRPPRFDKRHRSVLHDTPFDKFVYLLQKACVQKAQCWPVVELNEALKNLFDGLPSKPVKIRRISSIIDCMPLQYLIQLFRRGAEKKLPEGECLDFIRTQTDNVNDILSFLRARTTRRKFERAKSL